LTKESKLKASCPKPKAPYASREEMASSSRALSESPRRGRPSAADSTCEAALHCSQPEALSEESSCQFSTRARPRSRWHVHHSNEGDLTVLRLVFPYLQSLSVLFSARAVCQGWGKVGCDPESVVTVVDVPHPKSVERCTRLKSVKLTGFQMAADRVQDLCGSLTGKSLLEELDLCGLDLSASCTSALLAAALRSCPILQSLRLDQCCLTGAHGAFESQGAIAIFDVLRRRCGAPLRALQLSRNNLTANANSFAVTDALALLIRESASLTTLHLDSCSLTAAGAGPVLEALAAHKSIRDLNLANNTAGSVAVAGSAKLLCVNGGVLQQLRIGGNGLRSHQVQELAHNISKDGMLKILSVGSKDIQLCRLEDIDAMQLQILRHDSSNVAVLDVLMPKRSKSFS